jgi:two-component system phosphate regulon sensor histidine kinase PhoR
MQTSGRGFRTTLMVSSIVLLLVLQFFWLASAYKDAYGNFRRETSSVLRATVFTLRDSVFIKGIDPSQLERILRDTVQSNMDAMPAGAVNRDTLGKRYAFHKQIDNGHIIISSTTATIDSVFNDSIGHNNGSAGHRLPNMVIRLGPDTLSIKTVAIQYSMALQQLGVKMPFVIKHLLITPAIIGDNRWLALPEDTEVNDRINKMSSFSDTLYTERIRINPIHGYAAMFLNMRFNVLKDMLPEILFSAFLTFITLSTFWIMYTYIGKQEQLMTMKNDFISNVTHELKTPVATVSVALEALRDFNALENPVRTKEYLSIAQNELNRLILMTDKILKTAVFEQKGL